MVSGRIYVTEDKILCGSREGTAEQLYPHFMDLSTYTTKEELETAKEELKELIGVNAKIVGTKPLHGNVNEVEIPLPECDFIKIIHNVICSVGITMYSTIVFKGDKGIIHPSRLNGSSPGAIECELNETGTNLIVPGIGNNNDFIATIVCYKYI